VSGTFDFYGPQYSRFNSDLAIALRREVYGADIGQQGWRTLDEQRDIVDMLGVGRDSHVLDIACGAGGPALAMVEQTGCRITGLDVEAAGISQARADAERRGLADRALFDVVDCGGPIPFDDCSFDGIACIDAICHLPARHAVIAEWARLLVPRARIVFSDPAVCTGPIAKSELDIRASAGFFQLVPRGINEDAIQRARLTLVRSEDRTAANADIAIRWHTARARHAAELQREEGTAWFEQRQRFLAITAELSGSGRLSRLFYVAEKP
jgi:SAM-dependent methyltransferase